MMEPLLAPPADLNRPGATPCWRCLSASLTAGWGRA
jgi:hypothetical protein